MKLNAIFFGILFILFSLIVSPHAFAGGQHSIGTDFIRLVDQSQDGGMLNLYYQYSLTRNTAIKAGFSMGDDLTIAEASYKYYTGKYFDSAYGQAGFVIGDYDDDTELGITAAIGYEKSLARHFVLGFAVEVTAGTMEHPATGDKDPIFRPILELIFAF
jgi:hypothetical protein